jgi:hypothetical protein
MRTLVIKTIVCFAALLPLNQLQAQSEGIPAAEQAGAKLYGGFAPGKTFYLRVKEVTIIKTGGKVPKSIPSFAKQDKIKFTIGTKGELVGSFNGKTFKAKFIGVSANINEYLTASQDPFKLTTSARIAKNTSNKPISGVVTFNINTLSGVIPSSFQVSYTF